jgi:hypothetical protein
MALGGRVGAECRGARARWDDKIDLAREVVLGLVARQAVELWRGAWPEGAIEPLDAAGVEQLRIDDPAWYDPEHARFLVVIRQGSQAERRSTWS